MRAAILLVPFAALAAAYAAGRPPIDPYANAMVDDEMTMTMNSSGDPANDMSSMDIDMNAAEQAAANAEAAAENAIAGAQADLDNALDMGPDPAPSPAWQSGDMWLVAGEEPSGSIWYFEALESDFTRSPLRVILHTNLAGAAGPRNTIMRVAEVDCDGGSYRMLSTTRYDDAGNASEANERGDGRMKQASPGTIHARVVAAVCDHARGNAM